MHRQQDQRGFTLLEVLIVLVIVAIMLAMAVLSFGDFGRSRREKIALEQFSQVIQLAQQQAILQPAVLGLLLLPHGYQFLKYWQNPKTHQWRWIPLSNDRLTQTDAFPNRLKVKLQTIQQLPMALGKGENHPRIVILPNGFVTPFSIKACGHHCYQMQVSQNAQVHLQEITDAP